MHSTAFSTPHRTLLAGISPEEGVVFSVLGKKFQVHVVASVTSLLQNLYLSSLNQTRK